VPQKVLIAGASGLVGAAAIDRFVSAGGWEVVAVSRRRPETETGGPFEHVAVDLRDASACRSAFGYRSDITHVVYAAVSETPGLVPGWRDLANIERNGEMLRNLLEPLGAASAGLEHVSLLQGTKAYGGAVRPMRIPARERQPRVEHPNFYWVQEDYLREKTARRGWRFTVFRPQLIVGPNYGVAMNLTPVIGAYAAICQAEGRPFGYPGGPSHVWEAVDARLIGGALVWAATAPAAAGETFNLTNGEVFEWRDLWPALADTLGVPLAPDEPTRLSTFLPAKAEVWDTIVARQGLRPVAMGELLGESHHYADLCFNYGNAEGQRNPAFVSTVKIKQAGFTETWDTEQSFRYWLRVLMDRKVLPAAR
jgi:nucleoside-diphosphate-sugar epimerase